MQISSALIVVRSSLIISMYLVNTHSAGMIRNRPSRSLGMFIADDVIMMFMAQYGVIAAPSNKPQTSARKLRTIFGGFCIEISKKFPTVFISMFQVLMLLVIFKLYL